MMFSQINWAAIGPELILTVSAVVLLMVEAIVRREEDATTPIIAMVGVIIALVYSFSLWGRVEYAFNDMLVLDNFSTFFNVVFLLAAALTILLSVYYVHREGFARGEYYVLLLFTTIGMMLMAAGTDLMTIFLGLEILSISVYVLCGFFRTNPLSSEASIKYFLLGAFSTGILLYGIALIYTTAGTTNLVKLTNLVTGREFEIGPLFYIGMGLMMVGFGFKVATVPFHMWVPDVYQGAPTSITAFMSAGVKAAGFSAFLRVFLWSLSSLQADWGAVLWLLANLTMVVGNVIAVAQSNIKRLLAYSSIAHAGYILVAMVSGGEQGNASVLFYLLAYTFMSMGAFGVVIVLGMKGEKNIEISDYAGLGHRYPLLGAAMIIFMISLAGVPPTAGFVGKLYIFSAAVKSGHVELAVIGVLMSAVSLYYYLRIIVAMYMTQAPEEVPVVYRSPAALAAIAMAVAGTLQLGIFPARYLELARQSVRFIAG